MQDVTFNNEINVIAYVNGVDPDEDTTAGAILRIAMAAAQTAHTNTNVSISTMVPTRVSARAGAG